MTMFIWFVVIWALGAHAGYLYGKVKYEMSEDEE